MHRCLAISLLVVTPRSAIRALLSSIVDVRTALLRSSFSKSPAVLTNSRQNSGPETDFKISAHWRLPADTCNGPLRRYHTFPILSFNMKYIVKPHHAIYQADYRKFANFHNLLQTHGNIKGYQLANVYEKMYSMKLGIYYTC